MTKSQEVTCLISPLLNPLLVLLEWMKILKFLNEFSTTLKFILEDEPTHSPPTAADILIKPHNISVNSNYMELHLKDCHNHVFF